MTDKPEVGDWPTLEDATTVNPLPKLADEKVSEGTLPRAQVKKSSPSSGSSASEKTGVRSTSAPSASDVTGVRPSATSVRSGSSASDVTRAQPSRVNAGPSFESSGQRFPASGMGETQPMGAVGAAAAGAAVPPAPVMVNPDTVRRTRKARLRLTRVDPWSVMKTAFLFSVAFGIMLWVSVYVVWSVVEASGLFESLNNVANTALGNPDGTSNFHLEDYLNTGRILGYTALLSVLNIVIFTALATLFSFLYNLSATVLGGLEVTLAED